MCVQLFCCVCWTFVAMWTDLIVTLAGMIWWLVAALVLTRYNAVGEAVV